MADIRITMLVENTARGPGLLAEHGLSYWIETPQGNILFDTGQGGVLIGNAYKLRVSLAETNALVLSHGHYDHTGGVADALQICGRANQSVAIYAHPAAFARKFACERGKSREIGMPYQSNIAIHESRHRLLDVTQPTEVFAGLTATGPVPRETKFEDTGGPFFLDDAGVTPDPLEDDQSLFFDTAAGTVVLLGCAHSGIVNTLRYIRRLTHERPLHSVIGGMHLVGANPQRIDRTLEELRQFDIGLLAPAHCTGMAATAAMWNAFPTRCTTACVGTRFEF